METLVEAQPRRGQMQQRRKRVIRYIGPVHFEEGTWLGVELGTPNGRNDGSVQGRRYFSCKPNHGLIVRPNKVTVRGINSAKLFEEQPHS